MKKNCCRIFAAFTVFSFAILVGCDDYISKIQQYQQAIQQIIKNAAGSDYNNFHWFSLPTSGYGIGTSYNPPGGIYNGINLDTNEICTTWDLIGMDPPTNLNAFLNLDGKIKNPPSVDLGQYSQSDLHDAAFSTVLPLFFKTINISSSINWSNEVNVSINMGTVYSRFLPPDKITEMVMTNTSFPSLKKSYLNGTLVTAVADLVLVGFTMTIQVTNDFNGSLTAALSNSAISSIIASNSSISVSYQQISGDQFVISNRTPIIECALYCLITPPAAATNELASQELFTPLSKRSEYEQYLEPKFTGRANMGSLQNYLNKHNLTEVKIISDSVASEYK